MNTGGGIVYNLEAAKKSIVIFRIEVRGNRIVKAKNLADDEKVRSVSGSPATGRLSDVVKGTAMVPGERTETIHGVIL